jgi:type II secretory ATPase GspE/PulE/Tfp pilus assembly ATPase PilB-like protein
LAFRHDVLPLELRNGVLTIGLSDPSEYGVIEIVRRATRLRVVPVGMPRDTIRERLQTAYAAEIAAQTAADRRSSDGGPAVRAVDAMFERAIAAHASDVHVEPRQGAGIVRIRVDGVLAELEAIRADLTAAFVSRIKLLAGMDIADKRQPQDGRCTLRFDGRTIDARVSSMPTIEGEKLVIRLLDLHAQTGRLDALGLPADLLARLVKLVRLPWGFVVVTGPTGSGKTTTLYAALAELDAASKNICSVEDPVEMRVPGVTQVGVNPRAGLTFASALRSFMRQDPNVIMVGEMRDAETAAVAIAASLAGQLVLTTLHSNDAPRTIERLVELGVARQSLAAGLTAVVAQRLVRRLCEECRTPAEIPATLRNELAIEQTEWWTANGCGNCGFCGYSGRFGVYELLAIDDRLRDAIASGGSSVALAELGAATGYRPMFFDGLAKVLAGATSFEELVRVVGPGPTV